MTTHFPWFSWNCLRIVMPGVFMMLSGNVAGAADLPVGQTPLPTALLAAPAATATAPVSPCAGNTAQCAALATYEPQEYRFDDWKLVVQPKAPISPFSEPKTYERIYQSIPFRQTEYMANPSYRHDATMEFLFGQMRPTVINRQDTPQRIVNEPPALTQPYPISKGELWSLPWAYYTPWFGQWPLSMPLARP